MGMVKQALIPMRAWLSLPSTVLDREFYPAQNGWKVSPVVGRNEDAGKIFVLAVRPSRTRPNWNDRYVSSSDLSGPCRTWSRWINLDSPGDELDELPE